MPFTPSTKWSILVTRRDELQRQLDAANAYLEGMEKTPCNLTCVCGTYLATEADFAKHYTIPDERYLNLGDCPIKDAGKKKVWNGSRYVTVGDEDDTEVDLLDDPWRQKESPQQWGPWGPEGRPLNEGEKSS